MARINKQSCRTYFLKSPKGQATVEYVLLLTVAVAIAAIITKSLVSRNPDEAGILIERWKQIQTVIGKDIP